MGVREVSAANTDLSPAAADAVPQGYKQTEVGVIPASWDVMRLGDLFEITSSKRVFQSEWKTDGIPFYRARELAVLSQNGSVDNALFITKSMYDSFKRGYGVPSVSDMLITGVGTLGKVYVVHDEQEFYFKDGNIIWLKSSSRASSFFVEQLFLTPVVVKQIEDGAAGTTVGTYTISGAKRTIIPFPAKAEQEAIAEALSDADTLIGSLQQLIAKKRQIKQGAMQSLLTGQQRLPGFSGKWEAKSLGDLGVFLKGSGVTKEQALSGALACIRYGELYTKHNDRIDSFISWISAEVAESATRLKHGDVLFAGSGETKAEIGKCAAFLFDVPAYAGGDIVILRGEKGDPLFMGYYLNTNPINAQKASKGQGDAVVHISAQALASIEICLPERDEQTAIATILSDMDAEITALEARLGKTSEIKQGMMQVLLTGAFRLPLAETA